MCVSDLLYIDVYRIVRTCQRRVILTLIGRILANPTLSLIVPRVLMLFRIDKVAQFCVCYRRYVPR